jgi:hypothetical protein
MIFRPNLRSLAPLAALLLLSACAAREPKVVEPPKETRVLGVVLKDVNARINPSLESSVLTIAFKDTLVALMEERGGWYHVNLGAVGGAGDAWIKGEFVAVDPPPLEGGKDAKQRPLPGRLAETTALRAGPGRDSQKKGDLAKGANVIILERVLGWYRLAPPHEGWADASDILIDVAEARKPPPPPVKDEKKAKE